MFEKEDDDVKEIVAFVHERAKKSNKPRYGEIHEHFPWGQSKWQSKWNAAKNYLDRRVPPKGGYRIYDVKQDFKKDSEKNLFSEDFRSRVLTGDLNEVKVSSERADMIAKEFAEGVAKGAAWDRLTELSSKNKAKIGEDKIISGCKEKSSLKDLKSTFLSAFIEAFASSKEDFETVETLRLLARYMKIHVVSEKGLSTPVVSDADIMKLLEILFLNLYDPNTYFIRKSFHIVASFEVPEDIYDEAMERHKKGQQSHSG